MKKILKTVLVIIFLLSIIELINIYFLSIRSKMLEIRLEEDKIITLCAAVGKKRVVGYNDKYENNGVRSKIFTYRTSSVSENDIYTYISKLKNDGFTYTDALNTNIKQLGKKSIDENKYILINFEYDSTKKFIFIKYIITKDTFKKSKNYY